MTQRAINQWAGPLNDNEDLEVRTNIHNNFTDLFPATNYADELAAAKGGLAIGQQYHTNGTVKVRYSDICVPATGALGIAGKTVTRS